MGQKNSTPTDHSMEDDGPSGEYQEPTETYNGNYFKAVLQWQSESKQLFKINKPCDIGLIVQDLKVLPKNSASDSIVMIGDIPAPNNIILDNNNLEDNDKKSFGSVAIKVTYPSESLYQNQLVVEQEIVSNAFSELFERNFTPNITAFISKGICPDDKMFNFNNNNVKNDYFYRKNLIEKIKTKSKNSSYLVIEKGDMSLFDLLSPTQQAVFTYQDLFAIIFQVYFALACFARMGIRHNDLHLGNILIKLLSKPEDFLFEIPFPGGETKIFKFSSKYIVKIYDMDRGSAFYPHIERNLFLDVTACPLWGECNFISPKFDVGGFNMSLANHLSQLTTLSTSRQNQNVYKFWFNFIVKNILGEQIYSKYQPMIYGENDQRNKNEYSQHFLYYARDDDTTIKQTLTPLQCIHTLLSNIEYTKSGLTIATETMISSYGLGAAFHLPNNEYGPHFGHPTRNMLTRTHFARLNTNRFMSQKNNSVGNFVPFATLFKYLQSSSKIPLDLWMNELNIMYIRSQPYFWLLHAEELYQRFVRKNNNQSPPGNIEMFETACLLLTCPMYYGLEDTVKIQLRYDLEERIRFHFPQKTYNTILECENMIFNKFDQTLPLQIPLLYNLE